MKMNDNLLYWYNQKEMWKDYLHPKEKYEAAMNLAYFCELIKQFPLEVIQKRKASIDPK
jgi:hypothetical protein